MNGISVFISKKKGELAFMVGVFNLTLSAWIIGSCPHYYWIWYGLKNAWLLNHRFYNYKSIKRHYFMFDFCYVANYLSFLYFLVCVAKNYIPLFFPLHGYLDSFGGVVFRILYVWSQGPIAAAIVATHNSMVFHSSDQMTSLAIHTGPMFYTYTMRWYANDLEAAWPNLFHMDLIRAGEQTTSDLFIPAVLAYFLLWIIPYYIFIFVLREQHIKDEGYETVYSYYSSRGFSKFAGNVRPSLQPIVYLTIHALVCMTMFLWSQIQWHYFWVNTLYLLFLLTVAVWNGATWYFKVGL